jgi:predicted membrane channel-forming protein YqfA (hemolysin III family)
MNATSSALPPMERRIRLASVLLAISLVIEALSLAWSHPTAFLLFVGAGGIFLLAGVAVYLYALVSVPVTSDRGSRSVR